MEVDWVRIEKELLSISNSVSKDILDISLVNFLADDVKLFFYASEKYAPPRETIDFLNNIKLANIRSILAMKMEVLMRRSTFRDYYDIYAILKKGINIKDGIDLAIKYSGFKLKTKNLISILTNSQRFNIEKDFYLLEPVYDVKPKDVELYIKESLERN